MKRKAVKIFTILLSLAYMMFFIQTISLGASGKSLVTSLKGDGSSNIINTSDGEGIIKDVLSTVLSAVRIVATGVALIMLTYLGIKYMSAAPNEKASIKNQLITYTVGAAVIVGTAKILEIIKNFANTATN